MSVLRTDAYKASMAEAGWPLRPEAFVYSHRRGGPQFLPFDPAAEVLRRLPELEPAALGFLEASGYGLGAQTRAALGATAQVRVDGLPRGAWFLPSEPVFTVSGPSALVSWLEPLILQLHFRIQVATFALRSPAALPAALAEVCCEAEREEAERALEAAQVPAPPMRVDPDAYRDRVFARARALVKVVEDPARIFEVGLRAASCVDQHLLALEACRAAGVRRTSHFEGARALGLVAVGTMGHEHVQRHGADLAAFRAMREGRAGPASFLLDTFDTLSSGLPAALVALEEAKAAGAAVRHALRFDSGDKEAQYREVVRALRGAALPATLILEDGLDREATVRFEALRREVDWPADAQLYGYGGHLVAGPSAHPFARDRVAAVYKLCLTGGRATMKFADEAGGAKRSLPGQPVLWRRAAAESGPVGLIAQAGEAVPGGYARLTGAATSLPLPAASGGEVRWSPATRALAEEVRSWS